MPRITDERRESRRAQIMDAALACFARSGYSRTSMTDIIAESGLSAGSIYTHFESKREILTAVAENVLGERMGELVALEGPASPYEVLRRVITGFHAARMTRIVLHIWADATVDDDLRAVAQSAVARIRATVTPLFEKWVSEHPEHLDGGTDAAAWARDMTVVVTGLLPGFVVQHNVFGQRISPESYLAAAGRILPR